MKIFEPDPDRENFLNIPTFNLVDETATYKGYAQLGFGDDFLNEFVKDDTYLPIFKKSFGDKVDFDTSYEEIEKQLLSGQFVKLEPTPRDERGKFLVHIKSRRMEYL